jgi:hypothetical protein
MRLLALLGLLVFCVPVSAEQLAVATENGDTLELHDRLHGKCRPEYKEAVYIYGQNKGRPPVDGCWKFISETGEIIVIFEDGDGGRIPVDVFTWKRGKKPVAL